MVDEVLGSKIDRGKLRYYIDWGGYPPEDRTWEPESHLKNAKEAVAQFHARYPNRPSPADLPHGNRSSGSEAKSRARARPRRGGVLSRTQGVLVVTKRHVAAATNSKQNKTFHLDLD